MWQRKQTLYLSLAILMNCLIFFLDLAHFSLEETQHKYNMYGISNGETEEKLFGTIILACICSISILLSAFVLSQFKKRQLQMKWTRFNLLFQLVFIAIVFFGLDQGLKTMGLDSTSLEINYQLGTFLSVPPLILLFFANKAIKKDDDLVRAADRIR